MLMRLRTAYQAVMSAAPRDADPPSVQKTKQILHRSVCLVYCQQNRWCHHSSEALENQMLLFIRY